MKLSEIQDKYSLSDTELELLGEQLGYSPKEVMEIVAFERGDYKGDVIVTKKKHLYGRHNQANHGKGDYEARVMSAISKPTSEFKDYSGNDEAEVNAVLTSHYEKEKLSSSESTAVKVYTGKAYRQINDALRRGRSLPAGMVSVDANLSKAIDRSVLDEDLILRRGVNSRDIPGPAVAKFAGLKEGDVWTDGGYGSTSAGKGYDEDIRMIIRAPSGTNALFVGHSGMSQYPKENEFILPKGTSYYVNSSKDLGNVLELTLTILPRDE